MAYQCPYCEKQLRNPAVTYGHVRSVHPEKVTEFKAMRVAGQAPRKIEKEPSTQPKDKDIAKEIGKKIGKILNESKNIKEVKMSEEYVPKWHVEMEKLQHKLDDFTTAFEGKIASIDAAFRGLEEKVKHPETSKAIEELKDEISKVKDEFYKELSPIIQNKETLKTMCERYPELCAVLEKTKETPPPPEIPKPEPAAETKQESTESPHMYAKDWFDCPECGPKMTKEARQRIQALLEDDEAALLAMDTLRKKGLIKEVISGEEKQRRGWIA